MPQPYLGGSHTRVYEALIAPNVENKYVATTYDDFPSVVIETRIWRKYSIVARLDLDWLICKSDPCITPVHLALDCTWYMSMHSLCMTTSILK